ncbi:MAG: M3 family metallopeptidase [Sandaracinus sp.]|nr:M3 family metallopeptidase [Sandaracinus sp.]MCB9616463.1 M3 family metallopeptidase [Sandaracinus sp.]
MSLSENPLLHLSFDLPFDRIEAPHVEPAVDELLDRARAALDAIVADTSPRTYASTLGALEHATSDLGTVMTIVGHLESVATTPELRAAYDAVQPKVSAFYSGIALNEGLYRALVAFSETDEARALTGPKARLLEKTLRDFRRHGAELPPEQKERLRSIDVELAMKTTKFSQNVLDDTNTFEVVLSDEAGLAGLPATARAMAEHDAESKGVEGWRFTLQAPSYIAVMTYADDAALREKLWRAYNTRATSGEHDNRALVVEILRLRREKAELLGYRDFADLVLEERMARSGEKAMAFVDDLRGRTQAAFERENEELETYARSLGAEGMNPWDVGYYSEKLRVARHAFDDEVLRPYFSVDGVLTGLFELAEQVFGVRVKERQAPRWDEAVRCFGIHDVADERLLAAFYVDLYPRENKRGGAWMSPLLSGASQEPMGPHLGLFCANVTRPVGGKPALLTHAEVETLFHEFGHLLHHAFSEVPVESLGGTNVAWDFVELPSQIMENFCWERVSLDLFARHYETGEPIPEELFQKMLGARTYRAASAQMRQLGFATMDLRLHRELDPKTLTPDAMIAFARDVLEAHSATKLPNDYGMVCGFTHLFASPTAYASGYYSYKWAEVLDADAFTRFLEHGVLSAEVGRSFREHVLSKGDSEEPDALFRSFMGRDPDLDALLARAGLKAA